MFALTVFVYPLVLALLCLGAGLAVDRCSGRWLPLALLPSVGAAALVALSQLSTSLSALAPATPYLMLVLALLGFALAPLRELCLQVRARRWLLLVPLLAYLLALAPVLLVARASFSSFMALSDSAVHMIGADYLIHHGQDYAHLDLSSSYGQFIENYYGTGYPSGADTLFGGSALLLRLPLIWAFQPFCGLTLVLSSGPAWLIAQRFELRSRWAVLAAFSATVPAIVYSYQLIGSVKELLAVVMLLALGVLLVLHERWLARAPRRVLPCALVLAGGVSALGVGFGAWALAAGLVLLLVLIAKLRAGQVDAWQASGGVMLGAVMLLIAAWPTWRHVSQSLNVAQSIASTGNSGNLAVPLEWTQAFGVWLHSSYKETPVGLAGTATYVLIVLTIAACLLGTLQLLRTRRFALAGWIAMTLLAWLVLSRTATTWVDAKALVLTSPVLVLLAWGGVGALLSVHSTDRRAAQPSRRAAEPASRSLRSASIAGLAAALLALALAGGALASDLAQYHSSNLAPTARYEELASIGKRFAGRGPALFTDFDEYSLYELRKLNISGPDFVYTPSSLASLVSSPGAARYGGRVRLELVKPSVLSPYELIVTRRDPSAMPPPAEYALAWHGRYYDVWSRRAGAPRELALGSAALTERPEPCALVASVVRRAARMHAIALATLQPPIVHVPLVRAKHPRGWGRVRSGWAMQHPGTLDVSFKLPRSGEWQLWLQGQFMPSIDVAVDGRPLASIAGQLSGNSLVPDTLAPFGLRLTAGRHRLRVTRTGFSLAPGNGGAAVLEAAFLTPAGASTRTLLRLPVNAPRSVLCRKRYRRVEIVRAQHHAAID